MAINKSSEAMETRDAVKLRGAPFLFLVKKENELIQLSTVDQRLSPICPDYRRYTGMVRTALREFLSSMDQGENRFESGMVSFFQSIPQEKHFTLQNPSTDLLDLVLETGLLVTQEYHFIQRASGEYRLLLRLQSGQADKVNLQILLEHMEEGGTDDGPVFQGTGNGKIVPLCRNRILLENRVYAVQDLGPLWKRVVSVQRSCTKKDVGIFLSQIKSTFPDLDILYEGFSVVMGAQKETCIALLFKEVDPYGYLHIQPVHYLEGYTPGFLEERDIIYLVELDEVLQTLRVSELIYGPDPVEKFKKVLSSLGRQKATDIYEEEGYFIITPDLATELITNHIQELIQQFVLLESQVLTHYHVRISRPRLKLHLSSGIDFLEGDAQVELDGQDFSYNEFIKRYKSEGYIKLQDESRLYVLPGELERLQRLINVRATKTAKTDQVEVSFFNYPALMSLNNLEVRGEAWDRVVSFYNGMYRLAETSEKAETQDTYPLAEGSLRPYQHYGVRWLDYVVSHHLGACLADDMGLGKTVQAIALLRKYYQEGSRSPSLILMPRSLLYNWEAELRRFAPELRYRIFHGAQRDEEQLKDPDLQIILSTYGTARVDQMLFQSIQWEFVILDESQNIKNMENKTSKAILSFSSQFRIAMSGTPIENHLGELYSLFAFLNPGLFGSHSDFMKTYMQPIQTEKDPEISRELRLKIYPFVLRRMKADVLRDLPSKTEQTVLIELDQEHLRLYHQTREEELQAVQEAFSRGEPAKGLFRLLKAMTILRRLAGIPEADDNYTGISAKREYFLDMVDNLSSEGHKCLVFTNFLATVDLLSEDLANRGLANLVMTGATVDRQALVRRFQTDPEVKVLIMTLKTGGVGLNLTAADYVFIFDPWWNRSAETQAIDRVHRIGQTKPVFSYRLIARGTIEERILLLQEQKVDLVSNVLQGDGDLIKSLSPEDIRFLLSGN